MLKNFHTTRKASFHEKLCMIQFPETYSMGIQEKLVMLNEQECLKAITIYNQTIDYTKNPLYPESRKRTAENDIRMKDFSIKNIYKSLYEHHFHECTGFTPSEFYYRLYLSPESKIVQPSNCIEAKKYFIELQNRSEDYEKRWLENEEKIVVFLATESEKILNRYMVQ